MSIDWGTGLHPADLPGDDYKGAPEKLLVGSTDFVELIETPLYSNDGGSADYYQLPEDATELQDLIEFKSMNFAQGNVFKAVYRMNDLGHHSNQLRDWKKIMWFAQREIDRLEDK